MRAEVSEAVSLVLAALKIESRLLTQAQQLSYEDRMRVSSDLARRKDQVALDLWARVCDAV